MASSLLGFVLLVLVIAGVKTTDVGLGQSCSGGESCVDANLGLVCDPVTVTCKIKQGQACSGAGHDTMCVAGAECVSSSCTCKSSVYTADDTTGKCTVAEDLWGGACPSDGSCTGAGLTCSTNNVCVCNAGNMVDLTAGTCSAITDEKIGHTCTVANSDTDCGDSSTTPQLSCPSGATTCTCSDGYTGVAGGDCAEVAVAKVGHACTSSTATTDCGDPATTHLECPASGTLVCGCSTGYYGVTGGDCAPSPGKLGGGCTGVAAGDTQGGCITSNAVCSGAIGTCSCATGYSSSGLDTCTEIPASKVGHTCTAGTATTDCGVATTTHLECSATAPLVCVCSTGYSGSPGGDCAVAVAPGKYGGSCTADTANTKGTCEDANALCSATTGGTCGCKTGYTGTNGAGCTITDNKYGGGCTSATAGTKGTCEDANALCSAQTSGTCGCKTGLIGTDGAGCTIPPGKYGGSCTADTANTKGTCEDANAQCSATTDGTCSCKTGYSGTDGAGCIADNKVGGACTGGPGAQGTCEDTNALCSAAGKCSCKDGYMGDDAGSCSEIPANTYGGSCTADTADTKGSCNDDNALCSATTGGFCDCTDGYTGTEGKGCAADNAVGGMCTTTAKDTKGTCTDDNAVCTQIVGGRCKCRMNYNEDSAGVCKASGAVALVASATAVMLSVFVGLLCMA